MAAPPPRRRVAPRSSACDSDVVLENRDPRATPAARGRLSLKESTTRQRAASEENRGFAGGAASSSSSFSSQPSRPQAVATIQFYTRGKRGTGERGIEREALQDMSEGVFGRRETPTAKGAASSSPGSDGGAPDDADPASSAANASPASSSYVPSPTYLRGVRDHVRSWSLLQRLNEGALQRWTGRRSPTPQESAQTGFVSPSSARPRYASTSSAANGDEGAPNASPGGGAA